MANVKVRLKDASNNVLHPETDWSVVLNRPSITVDQTSHFREKWDFSGYIDINSGYGLTLKSVGNEIQVADKNTSSASQPLKNYPINWSAISGKPSGTYVGSVARSRAVSTGNWYPGGRAIPGIYFYTGETGCNLIAFVCNDSEDIWGWYYDIYGQKKNLPQSVLDTGANLIDLAVYNYTFNTTNF